MIFPFLSGLRSIRFAPITWLLIFVNLGVMLWGWSVAWNEGDRLDSLMADDFFLETQGRVYESFLKQKFSSDDDVVRDLASTGASDAHHFRMMGHFAFRDQEFINEAPNQQLFNDKVAVDHWRHKLKEINDLEEVHPSFLLGISTDPTNVKQWVTYIFSHTSGWHFIGNMVFLLLFGAALEQMIGGLAIFVIFIATGMFAAVFFLWLCGTTTAPLIGASGAISGIMAMYCVMNWNKPTRFVYWFLIPTRDSMGFVYLPAWTALLLWILGDMAGYMGNLDIFGGVAHAAHLGGDIAGALCGVLVTLMYKRRMGNQELAPAKVKMWHLYPFFKMVQRSKPQVF